MDDKFLKYSRLYLFIFLLFLSIPVVFGLVIATFYGFSKMISSAPVDIFFELMIISIPAAIFTTAYVIFFIRTKRHPSPLIRIISRILFIIGTLVSCTFLVLDIISYFHKQNNDVSNYHCFNIFFLAGNIGGLFLIAIMQAFTTSKEKDWLEKRKEKERG